MKRLYIVIVMVIGLISGCSSSLSPNSVQLDRMMVTDSTGTEIAVVPSPTSVLALSASLAELWLEAGGKISGTTSDTFEKDRLDVNLTDASVLDGVQNVGTIKDPSAELILALKPDLVILSSTISGHVSVAKVMEVAQVPCYFADADSFLDYLEVFKDFTDLTGRADLYAKLGDGQEIAIKKMIDAPPADKIPSVLVLRAYSSGVKAKANGTVLTNILDDLGVKNIAAGDNTLEEQLSLEKIVECNPDYILIVYMGSDKAATYTYLKQNLYSDPVWGTLTAVREDRVIMLPQDLFHYKPNGRWEEAYAYLNKILYAE